jgi:hypothetical protein
MALTSRADGKIGTMPVTSAKLARSAAALAMLCWAEAKQRPQS